MELKEFLEKFLPDYEARKKESDMRVTQSILEGDYCAKEPLHDCFPEALQNFADKICEKQRRNCYTNWNTKYAKYEENAVMAKWRDAVIYAEQPKLEDLL